MIATPSFGGWGHKPAIIMGSGAVTTFAELEAASNRFAHLFRRLKLTTGDVLAVCVENCREFLFAACAAMRSGLTFVPVSAKLTAGEVAFIVGDSGAKALLTSPGIGDAFGASPESRSSRQAREHLSAEAPGRERVRLQASNAWSAPSTARRLRATPAAPSRRA